MLQSSIKGILAGRKIQEQRDALVRRNKYLERYVLMSHKASEIANAIKRCNILFRRLTNVDFLREDILAISGLHLPCENEKDLSVKLGSLASLFELDLDPIRSKLKKFDKNWKLVKLIEQWFLENNLPYDKDMFQTWRNLIDLRNASFPFHPTNARVVDPLQFFGHGFPINHPKLCDSILEKFIESLNKFQIALNAAASSQAMTHGNSILDQC